MSLTAGIHTVAGVLTWTASVSNTTVLAVAQIERATLDFVTGFRARVALMSALELVLWSLVPRLVLRRQCCS